MMNRRLVEIIAGDTNAQLTTASHYKDIAVFAISINAMLERNRRDLYEKIRAEAALKRAVTNISHDLRTPLTSALGYLQMLEAPDIDCDTRVRYLETIRGRLEALSVLMNSLFEFAQVIEGKTVLNITKVNVCNVLRDALSDCYTELEKKCFTVDVAIPEAPVLCFCDEDALRRVLQNLLKNVCVHGVERLCVRLESGGVQHSGREAAIPDLDERGKSGGVYQDGGSFRMSEPSARNRSAPEKSGTAEYCVIEISNKVDALDELDVDRIFDRFYTADASRTSKNTGLGLAIAKELAERMGGSITARVDGGMLEIRVKLSSGMPLDL